jgi:hypothetical protein
MPSISLFAVSATAPGVALIVPQAAAGSGSAHLAVRREIMFPAAAIFLILVLTIVIGIAKARLSPS